MDSTPSHYDVLGVPEASSASTESIKRAYKSLALSLHPDRGGDADAFVRVTRAWEVLRDARERRAYDAHLAARRRRVVVSDEVDLEDMRREEEEPAGEEEREGADAEARPSSSGRRYTHPCRCGDAYEVTAEDLHPDFDDVDVPCASCSLYVRVRYGGPRADDDADGSGGQGGGQGGDRDEHTSLEGDI